MPEVVVSESLNIIRVSPGCVDLLGPELTYWHCISLHGSDAIDAKKTVKKVKRHVYSTLKGDLYAMSGLRGRVINKLREAGYTVRFEDLRPVPEALKGEPDYDRLFSRLDSMVPSGKFERFRTGQEEVLSLLIGHDSGQIEAPVGWGKSFIVRALSLLYPRAVIIVVVPGKALRDSMYSDLIALTPNVGRVGGGFNKPNQITISTPRSVLKAPVKDCDILLYDEVHTAAAAGNPDSQLPGTSEILAQINRPYKRFGFSATPFGRADNAHLVTESLFGPVIYKISYKEAQADGAVAPMKVAMVYHGENEAPLYALRADEKLDKASKKRHAYWRHNQRNKKLAAEIDRAAKDAGIENPQVLIITETLEHAVHILKHVPSYHLVYGSADIQRIDGLKEDGLIPQNFEPLDDKSRERLRNGFETGEIRRVVATKMWGTGMNFVGLNILVYASGEPGEVPVVQWGGRGSRVGPPEKKFGIIIDCGDQFNKWARGRAKARIRHYRKLGWEVYEPGVKGSYRETLFDL